MFMRVEPLDKSVIAIESSHVPITEPVTEARKQC